MPEALSAFFLIVAALFVLAGVALSVIGALGLNRLPDMYTRLHATGKVGLFGVILLLLGVFFFGLAEGDNRMVLRAIILFVFLLIVGPTAAHAISSAAYRFGVEPKLGHSQRDDLARDVRAAAEELLADLREEDDPDDQRRVEERPKSS
jgi:multicomponent Na+:H+ antiporter subunit G